ncbi:MAG: sigma-70 family RNA polymerase sigma factor [Acidobacteria bacterium]|nr:sigma-70 family RNA polymerase sigma factor [Acidobacteriota bacterium]
MDGPPSPDFGLLLASIDGADAAPGSALFAALYGELHRIATREIGRQGWGVSLGATSLLHEAYLDLSKRDPSAFPDRNRFMGYAARVMRGLIVDYARNRQAVKRGGRFELTALATDALNVAAVVETDELVRISQALDDLSSVEPVLADVVDLKYFCGFSFEEIAAMKGVSDRTVRRYWVKARAFLHVSLRDMLAG